MTEAALSVRDRTWSRDPASFRDPSGFVFQRDGVLYRQINRSFADHWEAFKRSGLFDRLVTEELLVAHREVGLRHAADADAAAVLRPEHVAMISYPYEWSFGQLKDAALLTLKLEELAADHGMTLRDASAYNVQFVRGRPTLIDLLSFEHAQAGAPWLPYRQFCEHFLAPLAVMAYRDPRIGTMQRDFADGIPVAVASGLLPWRTRLRPGLLMHLHLHAAAQRRAARDTRAAGSRTVGETARRALLDSLRRAVEGLHVEARGTTWASYGSAPESYTSEAQASKQANVERLLRRIHGDGGRLLDLGANTGAYSRIGADAGFDVVAVDSDWAAVERHYRTVRETGERRILPLVVDLANPSPGLGWAHRERRSFADRAQSDVVMALALIHHLAIGGNLPLASVADYLAELGRHLVVEWVPKEDAMVGRLLAHRRDVFVDYTLDGFRRAFDARFETLAEAPIAESLRLLFLMRRRGPSA